MEEDANISVLVRPIAPAGSPPSRTSKAPPQPHNRVLTPNKPDALKLSSQRLPSAGLSAWEGDAHHPSADLTEYLGKANQSDDTDSAGISPTRATGPISGDGNLTHALLLARKAAEGRSSTASSGGESLELRHASDGSGSTPAAAATTATSDERRRPARLSQVSMSKDRTSSTSQQLSQGPSAPGMGAAAEATATENVGKTQKGTRSVAGGGRTPRRRGNNANPDGNGGSDGGGESGDGVARDTDGKTASTANAESERLRGLLYSDDDDEGGDEEYQDLMTADDEALFGGLNRSSGPARGGGRSRATSAEPTMGTEADDEGPDDSGLQSPFQRATNQRQVRNRVRRNRAGSRDRDCDGERTSRTASVSRGSADSGGESELAACGIGLQGPGGDSGSGVGWRAGGLMPQGSMPLVLSPGREQQREVVPYAAVPVLPLQVMGPLPQLSISSGGSYGANHHLQHHPHPSHHPHYASIPMPQLGEGLRAAPPNRRLYFPCSNNRSPVRGSGYVVSPAAVRPTSPVGPAGRSANSATSHRQGMRGVRRSASSSPTLAAPSPHSQAHSPRESHASGATPDPEEIPASVPTSASAPISLVSSQTNSTNYTSTGLPQPHGALLVGQPAAVPGGYKGAGAWPGGHGGGNSGGAGGQGSRFPPAAPAQQFGGGQVYRSRPISRTTSSPGDDTPGGAAAAGGGGGSGAARNNSASALNSRSGRQQQLRALSSATGHALPPAGGGGTHSTHMRDRQGNSTSNPIRPSTSPARTPATTTGSTGPRSPRRNTTAAGVAPVSVGAILGAGALSTASIIEAADGSVAPSAVLAAMSRALVVPAFPQYVAPLGIRHCGFKPLSGPAGVGGPASSSPYSVIRYKSTDDRTRSAVLGKILASVTGKEQPASMGSSHHDYSVLTMHAAEAAYISNGANGGGGVDSGGGGGGSPPASLAPGGIPGSEGASSAPGGGIADSALQQQQPQQQQAQQSQPHQQAQRRGSLPHLPLSLYQTEQGTGQNAGGAVSNHSVPLQAPMGGLALLGRSAAGSRISMASSETVSATAAPAATAALQHRFMQSARGFGFDAARRAASHA